MPDYSAEQAASRAGVTGEFVARMKSSGFVGDEDGAGFSDADIRMLQVLQNMERAGLPLEGLAALVGSGHLSLDFIESAGQYVFTPLEDTTFAQLSEDTGIPIGVLATIREAVGGPPPGPDARIGQSELAVLPLVQLQHELGFRERAIERALRVYGDSLRRIAETEAEWFRSEIVQSMLAKGMTEDAVGRFAAEMSPRISAVSDQAVMAIYHSQQGHTWLVNIISGMAMALERAGLHTVEQTVPAMCFLDIAGYTNLTSEHGDQVAADLAEDLRKVVQPPAMDHGGRAVKWLGDGVMFWFPDAGSGVEAAVGMIEGVEAGELPQAHVGVHAGPVVFQEGDYYGNTVNIAARIGDFARPGEVLVSQEVVDRAGLDSSISFREVGAVELKGVLEPMVLYAASSRRT
jgi:adenylate cyclase